MGNINNILKGKKLEGLISDPIPDDIEKEMEFPVTLYKRSRSHKIQQWTIEVEGNKFRTLEGFVDGAITPTEWTECKGKNFGKTNATSPEQQAQKEAEAKVTKKLDNGYSQSIENVDIDAKKISPMLAKEYEKYKNKIEDKTIASQPKLDGMRGVGTMEGLFSRNGKYIPSAPHIEEEIRMILDGCPSNCKLDGELYNHDLKDDFDGLISLFRKTKLSPEDYELSEKYGQYHVYDIDIPGLSFAERYDILRKLHLHNTKYLKLVHTTFIEKGSDELTIDSLYDEYRKNGYEGQMIRIADSMYENDRTSSLLKRKDFIEEEFILDEVFSGKGNKAHMAAYVTIKDIKGNPIYSKNGEQSKANMSGTNEFCTRLLKDAVHVKGSLITLKFFRYGKTGAPYLPTLKVIRDYE